MTATTPREIAPASASMGGTADLEGMPVRRARVRDHRGRLLTSVELAPVRDPSLRRRYERSGGSGRWRRRPPFGGSEDRGAGCSRSRDRSGGRAGDQSSAPPTGAPGREHGVLGAGASLRDRGRFPRGELLVVRLRDRGVSRRHGPVVVSGDAAHAMTPNLGQGGAQAVEDAWVLAGLLGGRARPTVEMLEEYEVLRRRKADLLVRMSRWTGKAAPLRLRLGRGARNSLLRLTPQWAEERQARAVYDVASLPAPDGVSLMAPSPSRERASGGAPSVRPQAYQPSPPFSPSGAE